MQKKKKKEKWELRVSYMLYILWMILILDNVGLNWLL